MAYDSFTGQETVDDFDDFVMENTSGHEKSAEELTADTEYPQLPIGIQVLRMRGFAGLERDKEYRVWVGEDHDLKPVTYKATEVTVILESTEDPTLTVNDTFVMPPGNKAFNETYFTGIKPMYGTGDPDRNKKTGKLKQRGVNANKFYSFMSGIGFSWPKGGSLPAEAAIIKNWKGRLVQCDVQEAYDPKTGGRNPKFRAVGFASYKPVPQDGSAPAASRAVQGAPSRYEDI